MLDSKLRSGWDRLMRPVGRALARTKIHPNTVTLLGVLIQAGVAYLIVEGRFLLAGLIAIVAGFADSFDGAVAKARGMTSRFGALLDSTTDRLADALYFVPIAWFYAVAPDADHRGQRWVAVVALATLVASFLVSYVKARAEGLGFDCKVGIAERAERLILVIAGLILDLVPPLLTVLGVLTVVTLVQRIMHVRAQAQRAPG